MAFAAETVVGIQQRDLRASAGELGGVEVGGDIALDDSDGELTRQFIKSGTQHRGLARTR